MQNKLVMLNLYIRLHTYKLLSKLLEWNTLDLCISPPVDSISMQTHTLIK